jgi:hypothetical protein
MLNANFANVRMPRIHPWFIHKIRLFASHLHCTERSAVQVFAFQDQGSRFGITYK